MAIQLDCFGARRLAMTVSGYTISKSALAERSAARAPTILAHSLPAVCSVGKWIDLYLPVLTFVFFVYLVVPLGSDDLGFLILHFLCALCG